MGEYWKPVNLDKQQQVHPHRLDEGLKLGEWYQHRESRTHARVKELLARGDWSDADEVRVVSDYGGEIHLAGPQTDRKADYDSEWEDVSHG